MRNKFIEVLVEEAKKNDKIVLIIGDLGYNVVEPFQEEFPDRFFNAGICEQNMASMAAGLSSEGFHVFIYSIANFPTFRCAEQLRNDIGYHNLNVTVVSVGGGLSYGNLGYSHHAVQDLGLIRLFPEFKILAPGDPNETEGCMQNLFVSKGPSYLRLKKAGEANYNKKTNILEPGIWNKVLDSKNKKIFLTTSGGLKLANDILENEKKYKDYGIYTCPIWGQKFKYLQQSQINNFSEIITVEDHLEDGGFGSWIRESVTNTHSHLKLINMALKSDIIGAVGSEKFLLKLGGFNQK
jgi:transketolase